MVGVLLRHAGHQAGPRPYLHSHMLGVLPDYRDAGIGRRLKLRQREEALARGIELIEWTFDPLELKNAFFNIERLGAIVRRYSENQYGVTASPLARRAAHRPLHRRMVARFAARAGRAGGRSGGAARRGAHRLPRRYRADSQPKTLARAREIQRTNGEKFQRAFERGLAVTGFERSETEGTYLLEPWP